MARLTEVVSFSAPPGEVAAWRAACGNKLSPWIREKLNAALGIVEITGPAMDIRALIQEGVATALAAKGIGSVPAQEAEQPLSAAEIRSQVAGMVRGATTIAIPADEEDRLRQRGIVASFIRVDGREWRGNGPDPLQAGCMIRADVLAEYAPALEALGNRLASQQARAGADGRVVAYV